MSRDGSQRGQVEQQEERATAEEHHLRESCVYGGVVAAVAGSVALKKPHADQRMEPVSEMSAAGTSAQSTPPADKQIKPVPASNAPAAGTSAESAPFANEPVNPASAYDAPAAQVSAEGAPFVGEHVGLVPESNTPATFTSAESAPPAPNVSTAGILAGSVPPLGKQRDASAVMAGTVPPPDEQTDAGVWAQCLSPAVEQADTSAAGTLAEKVPPEHVDTNSKPRTAAGVSAKCSSSATGAPESPDSHMCEAVTRADSSLHASKELVNHVGAPAQSVEDPRNDCVPGDDPAAFECAPLPAVQNGLEGSTEPEPRRSARARKPSVRIRSPGPDIGDHAASEAGALLATPRQRLRVDRVPPNLLALVSHNLEVPDSIKSLPSKMERMKFSNGSSLPLKKKKAAAKRLTKENTFKVYYRLQCTPKQAVTLYLYECGDCSFRTRRLDNLVRHKKTDCPHVKDFFSWDNNNFKEATQTPKKRALSPGAHGEGGNEETVKNSSAKRKGSPRKLSDMGPKALEKKESASAALKSKRALEPLEESSEEEEEEDPSTSDGTAHEKLEFSEDDVVWVEWKRLHWPALVRKVYPKSRKAKLFLIGSVASQETILVNIKKMFNFNNAERNRCFLNEGRVGRDSALVKAAQKAEEFLRKRCLGVNINAKKFFCDGEVPFTEGPPSDASDDVYLDSELWLDCDLDPSEASGDQLEATVARIKERRKRQNEKLVQCIKDGKVNSHLLAVLDGSVPSERHKLFGSPHQSERLQLKHWPWFGPIDNCSQQEEIYEFCFELLKANSALDPTFDIASYVIEVWCPEAVMKALCYTRSVDMEKAEEILLRAVIHSRVEQEASRRQMLANPPTAAQRREHAERLRNEFRDIDIEDEVLNALNF